MGRALLDDVRSAIRRYGLLAPGDTVLAAVSGGPDSVAMLAALAELRAPLGMHLVAAHLDHRLRGVESAADAAFVERLAARLDVPLRSESATLAPGNVEAEARRARYAFLERAADEVGAQRIATAHTLEDQAETVLMRVLRGAGRRGLGGIAPRRDRVIRPLILCDRVQVRSFLVERGLEWRRDRSNFDLAYDRARVRFGFLPALAREFNPRLTRTLARLADVMREEDCLLDRLAGRVVARGPELDVEVLRAVEPALARRAVRLWWRRYGSGRRLALAHVDAALALVRRGSGAEGTIRVPGGVLVRRGGQLGFEERATEVGAAPYAFSLASGQTLELPGSWRLRAYESAAGASPEPGPTVCVLDAEQVPRTFTVRNRRPGDRLRVHGLGGHTTVKRLLIARGVPRGQRATHPIVLTGREIVWVPACARSDRALVTPRTRRTVVIAAERIPV